MSGTLARIRSFDGSKKWIMREGRNGISRSGAGAPERQRGEEVFWTAHQPIDPSICSSISRLHSTAYSIGSVRVTGSMKPFTTMPMACSADSPRLIR